MNERSAHSRSATLWTAGAAMVAAVLGAAAFWPALRNEFVWDDLPFILDNPAVTQSGPWYRFWDQPYWPKHLSSDKLYRPLTTASFRLNVVLSGRPAPEPWNFHIVNLALHALTSAGVAWLAWKLTRRAGPAWIAGPLFATHPLHTEAVVTGYGRSELLAGLFSVWLMARYMGQERGPGYRVQGSEGGAARREGRGNCASRIVDCGLNDATVGCPTVSEGEGTIAALRSRIRHPASPAFHILNALLLLAAIMSKEHAVFVWPVLAIYDLWRYRAIPRSLRISAREWLDNYIAPAHAAFMLAISAFFMLRYSVFGWHYRLDASDVSFWQSPVAHASLMEHLLIPFRLLWLTAKLIVWPPALCPVWSIPALSLPQRVEPDVAAGMALAMAWLMLCILAWKRARWAPILAGLLILLAMPIQALPLAHWIFAERWLYLPSILIAVLVGVGLSRIRILGPSVGLSAALVLLPASWQYTACFRDTNTMFEEIVRRQPDNFNGWRYLAKSYHLAGRHEDAIQAARETIQRFSDTGPEPHTDPYLVLAKSYLAQGDGRRALEAIDKWEWLRRNIVGPGLDAERRQAEELIRQQEAQSRPASAPAD